MAETRDSKTKDSEAKVELVFFEGCPSLPRAREALKAAGVTNPVEVVQDTLPEGHPGREFTSPSILVNGSLVVGLRQANACTVADWASAAQRLRLRLGGGA